MNAIPVFMYHHINHHVGDLVTLTPQDFENHLRVLRDRRIQTFFLDELVQILRGKGMPAQPSALLTFDDGHLDNWIYAFPLLKKYGMKATIFVITAWMGEGEKRTLWDPEGEGEEKLAEIPRHKEAKKRAAEGDLSVALHWEEARAMEASGLVDIQSHTHFHRDYFLGEEKFPRLDPEKQETLMKDLAQSKTLIEGHLKKNCRYLSWPWGKYDAATLNVARGLGFEAAVTTKKGVNHPGSEEMAIKRIVAKSGDASWFTKRMQIYSRRTIGKIYSRLAGRI